MFTHEEWAALNATDATYEILKFDHNKLEAVDVTFPVLKSPLKVIDLSHNDIKRIVPKVFYNLSFIEEVDLSYNDLKSENLNTNILEGKFSPDYFEPLTTLTKLDLSHNLLNNMPNDFFEHSKNLKHLKLNDNPFMIIHTAVLSALKDLTSLISVDMSRMELEELPEETFHPLPTIEWLKLEGNLFKRIPKTLRFLKNLKDLSLSDNPIGDLNDNNYLPMLPKLERLNMTYMMDLTSIGNGTLKGLPELTELYLNHNHHLSHIHADAFVFPEADNPERQQWPKVEKLFLDNNNLSSLNEMMLLRWNEMTEIHIHDNPWLCDCALDWVVHILMPVIEARTPHLINHIMCFDPEPMAGSTLKELSDDKYELRCLDKYGAHPERDASLLVALLVGVLLGIPMAFTAMFLYRRGCRRQGSSDYSRAFYTRASRDDFAQA